MQPIAHFSDLRCVFSMHALLTRLQKIPDKCVKLLPFALLLMMIVVLFPLSLLLLLLPHTLQL